MQNFRVGHVRFIFLVSISFALGPVFQWNMGLTVTLTTFEGCEPQYNLK